MKKKYFFEIGLLIIFLAVLSAQQTSSFVLNELNVTFPNGTANTLSFQFQGYFFNNNVSSYIMSLDNGSIVRNAPSFSQMTPVTSNSQSVNFTEIFSNVTIRYYLDGTRRVKEAIIINEKPYNTYSGDYLNITSDFIFDNRLSIYTNATLHNGSSIFTNKDLHFADAVMTRIAIEKAFINDSNGTKVYLNYSLQNVSGVWKFTTLVPINFLNSAVYPVTIDPTMIGGCVEGSDTITCSGGTFIGNYLHTPKNISIINAYLPGAVESTNNDITLNSSLGWINISNSVVEANGTGSSTSAGRITILNAPQNFYISSSKILAYGKCDDPGSPNCESTLTFRLSQNMTISLSTIQALGRDITGSSCGGCRAGRADTTFSLNAMLFTGGTSHILITAGNMAGSAGSSNLDAGSAACYIYARNLTTVNSLANMTCTGGDVSGTGARNGGSAIFYVFSNHIDANTTILVKGGDGIVADGGVDFKMENSTSIRLKGGNIRTTGTQASAIENMKFVARDIVLDDFNLTFNWETGSQMNLTNDIAILALFGTSALSNAINTLNYLGNFGMIITGSSTTNLNLGSLLFDSRINNANLFAPLSNLTSPVNNTISSKTKTFVSKVITNSTLANATLYIWNSTGAEINSSNVQILSGNSANTSINHTFLEDGDANNNFTWNVLVTDVDNLNSFQNRFNLTLTVDYLFPTITINTITTTVDSQTFTFNATSTNSNLQTCLYSVYNLLGVVNGLNNNQTYTCNTTIQVTASNFGTYQLYTSANDTAGNFNQTNKSFTLSESSSGGGTGGGGGTTIINRGNATWTVTADGGGASYRLLVSSGSKREKPLIYRNSGATQQNISITCEGRLCEYISFSNTTVQLPVDTDRVTTALFVVDFSSSVPDGVYTANIISRDSVGNEQVITVSASTSVGGILVSIVEKLFGLKQLGTIKVPYILFSLLAGVPALFIFKQILRKIRSGSVISVIFAFVAGLGILIFV